MEKKKVLKSVDESLVLKSPGTGTRKNAVGAEIQRLSDGRENANSGHSQERRIATVSGGIEDVIEFHDTDRSHERSVPPDGDSDSPGFLPDLPVDTTRKFCS